MRTIDFLTTLLVIFAGLIPFALELLKGDETNTSGLFLLIAIALLAVIYFVYVFIWSTLKIYMRKIEQNTKKIVELEKSLKYKEDFYKLEKRLSMLENKRGVIDPRLVIIVIILLLLLLYLKSQGFI